MKKLSNQSFLTAHSTNYYYLLTQFVHLSTLVIVVYLSMLFWLIVLQIMMDKSQWRSNVAAQLEELQRRSKYRDIGSNTWGAKMRRYWSEQSSENSDAE